MHFRDLFLRRYTKHEPKADSTEQRRHTSEENITDFGTHPPYRRRYSTRISKYTTLFGAGLCFFFLPTPNNIIEVHITYYVQLARRWLIITNYRNLLVKCRSVQKKYTSTLRRSQDGKCHILGVKIKYHKIHATRCSVRWNICHSHRILGYLCNWFSPWKIRKKLPLDIQMVNFGIRRAV